jgi:hypothetical protein
LFNRFEDLLADASNPVQQFAMAAQLREDRNDAHALDGFVGKRPAISISVPSDTACQFRPLLAIGFSWSRHPA